jgi:hypothetical protein
MTDEIQPGATSVDVPLESLPAEAIARLHQLEGGGGYGPLFSSDLSVNEFLLVEDAGFEPLGLVVGSSIYWRGRGAPHHPVLRMGQQHGRNSLPSAPPFVTGTAPEGGGRAPGSRLPPTCWARTSGSNQTVWWASR